MKSRRRISALQRFLSEAIAIWDPWEPVPMDTTFFAFPGGRDAAGDGAMGGFCDTLSGSEPYEKRRLSSEATGELLGMSARVPIRRVDIAWITLASFARMKPFATLP
jgi:hypothetical protein